MQTNPPVHRIRTSMLELAYEEHGKANGDAVVLLHGFPYDVRSYDEIAPALAAEGYRVIIPYLRGFGPTRFLSDKVMRSGEQAALVQDLRELLDGLQIERAALAGYDWGGRAACLLSALWPERVRCLVTGDGYNVQNIPASPIPLHPAYECKLWYQYYLHTPRGVEGLSKYRREYCRLLWEQWSPLWKFDDETFERTAISFDNPDFVEVVVHSYRHRCQYAPGDPSLEWIERKIEPQPEIGVPTISLTSGATGTAHALPGYTPDRRYDRFTGPFESRVAERAGHNIPQEAPETTLRALLDLMAETA